MRIVLDASVALTWVLGDENEYADNVLESLAANAAVVPGHWSLEVANALLLAERKGRTQTADTARAVALLRALPIERDEHTAERATSETIALAKAYGLTVYDAAYLELTLRDALPLASLDAGLLAAAKSAGAARYDP